MNKIRNQIINLLFLILLLFKISVEDSDWFYERNKNTFCPNRDKICYCNITYNNPYTPKIHADFLRTAVLPPHYHYIYLIFDFPKNQTQRQFYLEATDITQNDTVISNGDCYLINITNIYEYELRIYKPLLSNSIISIKFSGLNPQFFMRVKLKFPRDLSIYAYGVMLTDLNSLNKSNELGLKEYEKDLQQKIIKQNERKALAIEKTNKILLNLFGKTLNSDIEFKETTFTQVITTPFLIITVSMAVGFEESTENFFKPNDEEKIMSDVISINGDISLESDMFENIFDDKISVDNKILNVIKIFNKKVSDLILNIGFDTEIFSLTISESLIKNYITLTFRFYDLDTHKNFYEIEIKIELRNRWVLEVVLAANSVLSEAMNKAVEFDKKYGKGLDILIFAMIAATIILTVIILGLPAALAGIAAAGAGIITGVGALISQIAQSIPFEVPFGQVVQFIKF